MEINKEKSLSMAIRYCKKFGFISKDFFWNYLSPNGQSTKYRYWDMFLDSNYFIPYRELRQSGEYFYLNLKAAIKSHFSNITPVGKRTPLYFYHDEKVMLFAFALENAGLIQTFWSEQELRSNPMLSYELLGGDSSKLPDLVFELNCTGAPFRATLEIETTRKSNNKYYKGLLNYSALKSIDLIFFGVDQVRTRAALKSELSKGYFDSIYKKSAFFSIPEFEDSGLESVLELNSNQIIIKQFLKNLINLRNHRFEFKGEKTEKNFSLNSENSGIENVS